VPAQQPLPQKPGTGIRHGHRARAARRTPGTRRAPAASARATPCPPGARRHRRPHSGHATALRARPGDAQPVRGGTKPGARRSPAQAGPATRDVPGTSQDSPAMSLQMQSAGADQHARRKFQLVLATFATHDRPTDLVRDLHRQGVISICPDPERRLDFVAWCADVHGDQPARHNTTVRIWAHAPHRSRHRLGYWQKMFAGAVVQGLPRKQWLATLQQRAELPGLSCSPGTVKTLGGSGALDLTRHQVARLSNLESTETMLDTSSVLQSAVTGHGGSCPSSPVPADLSSMPQPPTHAELSEYTETSDCSHSSQEEDSSHAEDLSEAEVTPPPLKRAKHCFNWCAQRLWRQVHGDKFPGVPVPSVRVPRPATPSLGPSAALGASAALPAHPKRKAPTTSGSSTRLSFLQRLQTARAVQTTLGDRWTMRLRPRSGPGYDAPRGMPDDMREGARDLALQHGPQSATLRQIATTVLRALQQTGSAQGKLVQFTVAKCNRMQVSALLPRAGDYMVGPLFVYEVLPSRQTHTVRCSRPELSMGQGIQFARLVPVPKPNRPRPQANRKVMVRQQPPPHKQHTPPCRSLPCEPAPPTVTVTFGVGLAKRRCVPSGFAVPPRPGPD